MAMLKEIVYTPITDGSSKRQDIGFYSGNKEFIHLTDTQHIRFPDEMHVCVDARVGFKKHPHTIQLNSQTGSTGATIRDITTGPLTARMESIADPDDAAKVCWWLQVHKDDTDAQSLNAKRAEFNTSKNRLLSGETFTVGYKFRLNDYRTATDNFLIQQFKGLDAEVPFASASPWLGLYCNDGSLEFQIRVANSDISNEVVQATYPITNWLPDTWYSVVVEAKTSTARGIIGSIKVWLNGQLFINYAGEVGYFTPNNYVMCGLYQWGGGSWPWDLNFPMKTMYLKGLYCVKGARQDEMHKFIAPL